MFSLPPGVCLLMCVSQALWDQGVALNKHMAERKTTAQLLGREVTRGEKRKESLNTGTN